MASHSIEDALREIRVRAALLGYVHRLAVLSDQRPDADEVDGMGELCDDIVTLATSIRDSVPVRTLALDIQNNGEDHSNGADELSR